MMRLLGLLEWCKTNSHPGQRRVLHTTFVPFQTLICFLHVHKTFLTLPFYCQHIAETMNLSVQSVAMEVYYTDNWLSSGLDCFFFAVLDCISFLLPLQALIADIHMSVYAVYLTSLKYLLTTVLSHSSFFFINKCYWMKYKSLRKISDEEPSNKNIPELGNLQTPTSKKERQGEIFYATVMKFQTSLDHDRWARFQPQQCSKNSALMKQANVNTAISREDNIRRGFYRWPNSTHKQDYILSFPFVISENLPLKWKPFAVGLFLFCAAYGRNLRHFRSHFHSCYRGAFWTSHSALRTMLWVGGSPSQHGYLHIQLAAWVAVKAKVM